MTEELLKEMYLDCSNETIQGICSTLGQIYAQTLISHSVEARRPTPVFIEDEGEESYDTGKNNCTAEECYRISNHHEVAQSNQNGVWQ